MPKSGKRVGSGEVNTKMNKMKNTDNQIAKLLSEMYAFLSEGDWCICVTLKNQNAYCGKLLNQKYRTNPYQVFIVLIDKNEQEIHIDLADVENITKCKNENK